MLDIAVIDTVSTPRQACLDLAAAIESIEHLPGVPKRTRLAFGDVLLDLLHDLDLIKDPVFGVEFDDDGAE